MSNVAQLADSAATMTNLVDAAAAVETRLYNAESRVQALRRDLQQMQHRHDDAQRWIVAIRRSHRAGSHAATGRIIREALATLESGHSTLLSLF